MPALWNRGATAALHGCLPPLARTARSLQVRTAVRLPLPLPLGFRSAKKSDVSVICLASRKASEARRSIARSEAQLNSGKSTTDPQTPEEGGGHRPHSRTRQLYSERHFPSPLPGLERLNLDIPELATFAPGYIPAHPSGAEGPPGSRDGALDPPNSQLRFQRRSRRVS